MSTHNICFRGEIRKIICGYPLLSVAMVLWSSPSTTLSTLYSTQGMGDNQHEIHNLFSGKNLNKIKMLSADNFFPAR